MTKSNPKKRTSKASASKKNRKQKSLLKGLLWRVLFYGCLLGILFVLGVSIYLNQVVTSKFEGKRWALPARVYAQPLALFQGKSIYPDNLKLELEAANYRKVPINQVRKTAGTYARQGRDWLIHTREFQYWDKTEPQELYRVSLQGEKITRIRNSQGNAPVMRVDPAQIAAIYPNHQEDRDLVKLDDVPDTLVKALLAVEDRKFYTHHGVRPVAIARAIVRNIQAGRAVQGGSTLTQQLVKNYFLTHERTLSRKFSEAIMSVLLEWHYDKNSILQAYINEVFLGQDKERAIHGFGLAAHFYFDKSLSELSIDQQALLVGLVKGASYYNPRTQPERALARRNLVLKLMKKSGVISAEAFDQAVQRPLAVVAKPNSLRNKYPDFIQLVKRQLAKDYDQKDLQSEGLRVFTTLSPSVQYQLQVSVRDHLNALEKNTGKKGLEAAAIVTNSQSAEVLALLGSRISPNVGFNRALDARRQIGSLAKPAVYLTALEQGYTPTSMIADAPFEWVDDRNRVWQPKNYDFKSHGMIPLYRGLVKSYNISTARLGLDVGVENVSRTFKKLGLQASWPEYPSILLGAIESSVFGVAQMYQTLASDGFYSRLRAVNEVVTAEGQRLNRYALEVEQRTGNVATFITNNMLQTVVNQGTARRIGYTLPHLKAAGKTGTTNNGRDAWFAGFTGGHLAVVWVGRDKGSPMNLSGSRAALPIWQGVFKHIKSVPYEPLLPEDVAWIWVNEAGERVENYCQDATPLAFSLSTIPPQTAHCTTPVDLDADAPVFEVPKQTEPAKKPWYRRLLGG